MTQPLYWYEKGRYHVSLKPEHDEAQYLLKYTEGARNKGSGRWSLPGSVRSKKVLDGLGCRQLLGPRQDDVPSPLPQVPSVFGGRTLFPFQVEDLQWLRSRDYSLLYHQQGLGKTTLAIARYYDIPNHHIVCPLAVADQWVEECRIMGVRHGVSVVNQAGKLIEAIPSEARNAEKAYTGWVISNYERLAKLEIPSHPFGMSVDEATYIKNTKSKRSQVVLQWAARADHCLAITGTPIVNRPLDLWAIYLLLRERNAGEFWRWAQRYTGAYETPYGWDFSGATHLDELSEDISHFARRREKKDVLAELPPKRTIRTPVRYDRQTAARINRLGLDVRTHAGSGTPLTSGEGFASVQALRVESSNGKVGFCNDWLASHFEGDGSPVLVFSAFKDPLNRLKALVDADRRHDHQMYLYTGDQGLDERTANKQLLQQRRIKVLGLTYDAGGMGLNLQAASTVIILDPPWTPKELEQAEDRAHRIGQTQEVLIVHLVGDDPIEQQMYQGLEYKLSIVEAVHGLSVSAPQFKGAFQRAHLN